MRLFEFAPSSGQGSNFYQSTLDFANEWPDYARSWNKKYPADQAQEESEDLRKVAEAFMRGIEKGVDEYSELDTLLRDELLTHWQEDGIDIEIIYRILDTRRQERLRQQDAMPKSPAKKRTRGISGSAKFWEQSIREVYPNVKISNDGNVYKAMNANEVVGEYNPAERMGRIYEVY
jgi:hypothetical protein